MDMDKQIAHWRGGAEEDLAVARDLLQMGHAKHALFFAHLAVEKALKAHVAKTILAVPPRIHNLRRLAELAGIEVNGEETEYLADLNQWQIDSRYGDDDLPESSFAPSDLLRFSGEYTSWLIKKL